MRLKESIRQPMASSCCSVGASKLKSTLMNGRGSSQATVLVFDSGVGGLSVYQEVQKVLPYLHYIYVCDNKAFPYGEKSENFIIDRVLEIVSSVEKCHPVVLMIVACNTASTISLSALRKQFSFLVVGVVPAIKPATHLTTNGIVGLLATKSTIRCSYTKKMITQFSTNCRIELLSSSELVELAEAKFYGDIVLLSELKSILNPWLRMSEPPDSVVLGCTHFPLLIEELRLVFPKNTRLVDSSAAIACRTASLISTQVNLLPTQEENLAYCTLLDQKTDHLSCILKKYGFKKLKELPSS